jgi:hypothetical protein
MRGMKCQNRDAGGQLLKERQRVMITVGKEQSESISISQINIKSCRQELAKIRKQ